MSLTHFRIGVALFGNGILGLGCTYKISLDYAGGVEDSVLPQGFHLFAPWKKVIEYPISTETVYYTKSQDDKQVNVSVTYSFHIDADNLPTVFTKFRRQFIEKIEAGYIKNEMYQAINEVASQYSLINLVGDKRPEINAKIFDKFRGSLEEFGIVIETFNLSDVVHDEQIKEAIQKGVNAP